jgi:hypothetical protein
LQISQPMMDWNGVAQVILRHVQGSDILINFPWDNNSCGKDSSISALWCIYQKFIEKKDIDGLHRFEEEFPSVMGILTMLNLGEINNLQAKFLLIQEFGNIITDERYVSKGFYNTALILDTVKKALRSPDEALDSTFLWLAAEDSNCEACRVYIPATEPTKHHEISVLDSYDTVQVTIDTYLTRESTMKKNRCAACNQTKTIIRNIFRHPNVLHMFYGVSGGHAIWPKCLDRIIIFGNNYKSMAVKYEIVCAIYGSNAHFICRYFRRGKVYEADGMREHCISTRDRIVREAMSIEICEPYETALAGKIKIKKNNRSVVYTICDVFYMKI